MKKVTREEYLKVFGNYELKPISSFSDPDGVLSFGYGRPAMDTDWGTEEEEQPFCRCEMRKESRHQTEWEYTYYINQKLVSNEN